MPRADEMSILAFQGPTEVKARIGCSAKGISGPVDVNFAPEEWNQDGSFEWNIGQVAKFVFHKSSLRFICVCINIDAYACIVKIDAFA